MLKLEILLYLGPYVGGGSVAWGLSPSWVGHVQVSRPITHASLVK